MEDLIDGITQKYNHVKSFKEDLTKGANWFLGDFIVRKKDFEQQGRTLQELMERLENIEKEFKFPR